VDTKSARCQLFDIGLAIEQTIGYGNSKLALVVIERPGASLGLRVSATALDNSRILDCRFVKVEFEGIVVVARWY
jgi:hypothetical protein